MEYEKWERFYLQILEYFGYSQEEDERAAKILSNIFKKRKIDGTDTFNELRGSIKDREVYVFGAAPSLKKDLRRLFKRYNIEAPWLEVEKERREWQKQTAALSGQKDQEGAVSEDGVLDAKASPTDSPSPETKEKTDDAHATETKEKTDDAHTTETKEKTDDTPATESEEKTDGTPATETKEKTDDAPIDEPAPLVPRSPEEFGMPGTWIAADAAVPVLMELGILPHIIVSDLDGGVNAQIEACRAGSIMVIHAHGDNIPLLEEWVPKFEGKLLGTTQATPFGLNNVHNFGGFTDGDRAVFMVDELEASKITLVSFNFREPARKGERVAREEPSEEEDLKARKLSWASVLIAMLENQNITYMDER